MTLDDQIHQHLRMLEERNKSKRLSEERKLSNEAQRKKALERGFHTHFRGANEEYVAKQRVYEKEGKCTNCGSIRHTSCTTKIRRKPRVQARPTKARDETTTRPLGENVNNQYPKQKSRFSKIGSQIAAGKNRKTWGQVVEPSFEAPHDGREDQENNVWETKGGGMDISFKKGLLDLDKVVDEEEEEEEYESSFEKLSDASTAEEIEEEIEESTEVLCTEEIESKEGTGVNNSKRRNSLEFGDLEAGVYYQYPEMRSVLKEVSSAPDTLDTAVLDTSCKLNESSTSSTSRSFLHDRPVVTTRTSPIYTRTKCMSARGSPYGPARVSKLYSPGNDEVVTLPSFGSTSGESIYNEPLSTSCESPGTASPYVSPHRPLSVVNPVPVLPRGRHLQLNFVETWGDIYYLGLTGIVLLVKKNGALEEQLIHLNQISANPPDINVNGHFGDPRTLDKVIDGVNNVSDEQHMWLIEFNPNENHYMDIDLGSSNFELAGIRIWNYNKSPEDTRRGVKYVHVSLDGYPLSPRNGLLIRRATGSNEIEFGQTILFKAADTYADEMYKWCGGHGFTADQCAIAHPPDGYYSSRIDQDWEAPLFPCGHLIRIDFLAAHAKAKHIGIQDMQVFDGAGRLINFEEGTEARMVFVEGSPANSNKGFPWLGQVSRNVCNRIYCVFDEPVSLSMIKIWNYTDNPSMGAKEVAVYMDSMIIFQGLLEKAHPNAPKPHCIIYTPEEAVIQQVKQENAISYCGETEQTVVFIDNNTVIKDV